MRKREIVSILKNWLYKKATIWPCFDRCDEICFKYFKQLNDHRNSCPEDLYSLSYLRRRARQIIKELEGKK